jgi:hypothetical protein
MARVKRAGTSSSSARRGGIHVPGIYGRLLEREREVVVTPDPRWFRTDAGRRGEPCPLHLMRTSLILAALKAGEPVEVPTYRLGGRSVPDDRLRRMPHEDRSIAGWLVHADDMVVPIRPG